MQFFGTNDTMFQALKKGEIDYARKLSPEQFKQLQGDPIIKTVAGTSNGWTELGFNTYGTGHRQDDQGRRPVDQGAPGPGLPRRPRLRDRQAEARRQRHRRLRHDRDRPRSRRSYKPTGTPIRPTSRTFDIELAKQKLDAAGYVLDASGKRLDKEGKPISLRLVLPDYDPNFAKAGQFIKDWFGQLGIKVTAEDLRQRRAGRRHAAAGGRRREQQGRLRPVHLDLVVGPGPERPARASSSATRSAARPTACGATPTTTSCTTQQLDGPDDRGRARRSSTRCSSCGTTQAPYHILYYDDNLHAYRTDKFAGWQNQPADGTPLFAYGTLGYTLLTDATAVPEPDAGAVRLAGGGLGAAVRGAGAAPAAGGATGDQHVVERRPADRPDRDRRRRGRRGRRCSGDPAEAGRGRPTRTTRSDRRADRPVRPSS